MKKELEIKTLKPIIKNYLNSKKTLEYDKVFNTYYYELLETIKKTKNSLYKDCQTKMLYKDNIWKAS